MGEKFRENPKTIFLSLPIFGIGLAWFSLTGQSEYLSGSFGHLGLTFKLLYKHHIKNKLLLKIAYWLFGRAYSVGAGDSAPTVKMKLGEIAFELDKKTEALNHLQYAVKLAKAENDLPQMAYAQVNLGRLQIQFHDLTSAQTNLTLALPILSEASRNSESHRLHIWACAAEIGMAEYHLALADKKAALVWANKAKRRAESYHLKTRFLDVKNLFRKL